MARGARCCVVAGPGSRLPTAPSLLSERAPTSALQRDHGASNRFRGLHNMQRRAYTPLCSRLLSSLHPEYCFSPARLQGRQAPDWPSEAPIWSGAYLTSPRYQTTQNGPNPAIDGATGSLHAPCRPPFTAVVAGGTNSALFWRYCRQNLPLRLRRGADFRPLSRRPTPSNSYLHGHGVGINGPEALVD